MRTFKTTVKVKGCNVEFKEGMGVAVLATQEFDVPDEVSAPRLAIGINGIEDDLIHDTVYAETEEIPYEG